jgi:HD superfamily phosphodiesterase
MITKATEEMMKVFGRDERRIGHALKVLGFASAIADLENISEKEKEIVSLAALLHDIGIQEAERKYDSAAGNYQEIEGVPIARGILEACGAGADTTERVCFIVGHHHTYASIDGVDFQILVEADFLVNIHEEEMDKPAVESIHDKIFKTPSGTRILEMMYL